MRSTCTQREGQGHQMVYHSLAAGPAARQPLNKHLLACIIVIKSKLKTHVIAALPVSCLLVEEAYGSIHANVLPFP